MEVAVSHACKHCGRPAGTSLFCCAGCEGAFEFIHSTGMGEFYNKLSKPLSTVKQKRFEYWNQPQITTAFVKSLQGGLSQAELLLDGMSCPACGWLIERAPLFAPFIRKTEVDLGSSKVKVIFDSHCAFSEVGELFNKIGYAPTLTDPISTASFKKRQNRQWILRTAVALASQMASMHVNYTLYAGLLDGMNTTMVKAVGLVSLVISLPAVFYSAVPFYRGAWNALKLKTWNLDLLVSLSIALGFVASAINALRGINDIYFDAVTMLIAFLLLGRLVVMFSEKRISIDKNVLLLELLGTMADAKPGDIIPVKSGQAFPCDGTVTKGKSLINSAWLTGEEMPTQIKPGSSVYAGSLNLGSPVEIQVTEPMEKTRIANLISGLSNIKKGELSRFSEKFEKILVASVLLLVLGLGTFYFLEGKSLWMRWISVLLVTCPCAMGLAVPAVLSTALKQALRRGIIIKGGEVFERLAQSDAVVFDKTGTLTTSEFEIENEDWLIDAEEKLRLLPVLGWAAHQSSHPVLSALTKKYFRGEKPALTQIKETLGQGLEFTYQGHSYQLGSRKFLQLPSSKDNQTEILFSEDGILKNVFVVRSEIRSEAMSLVAALKKRFSVWMLSGDKKAAVKQTADLLNLEHQKALYEQTPEMKMEFLNTLFEHYKVVMVGDGVNDSLAFKKAHVGIGIGGAASSTLEACDVYLTRPDLNLIQEIFTASHKVKKSILLCLAWAVVYNVLGVMLVLYGFLGPLVCAVLMPLSSLTVVAFATGRKYFPGGT